MTEMDAVVGADGDGRASGRRHTLVGPDDLHGPEVSRAGQRAASTTPARRLLVAVAS